ncbi:hypothetical protein [Lactobacillus terrae]|uniref:hypothetical protein n=1 Tax=Lactobacillus terrae TaxID=2269374 RepID=UPI000C1B76C6|nr:hypothetical protein [Lactobacillus terrae]
MTIFLIVIDIFFLLGGLYSVYWQSQIEIRSIYKISALIYTVLIGAFLLVGIDANILYIIMVAEFLASALVGGIGGLGTRKIIASGLFSGAINYSDIQRVTIISVNLNDKPKSSVIFQTSRLRQINLSFNRSYQEIRSFLDTKLNKDVEVEIIDNII